MEMPFIDLPARQLPVNAFTPLPDDGAGKFRSTVSTCHRMPVNAAAFESYLTHFCARLGNAPACIIGALITLGMGTLAGISIRCDIMVCTSNYFVRI